MEDGLDLCKITGGATSEGALAITYARGAGDLYCASCCGAGKK